MANSVVRNLRCGRGVGRGLELERFDLLFMGRDLISVLRCSLSTLSLALDLRTIRTATASEFIGKGGAYEFLRGRYYIDYRPLCLRKGKARSWSCLSSFGIFSFMQATYNPPRLLNSHTVSPAVLMIEAFSLSNTHRSP